MDIASADSVSIAGSLRGVGMTSDDVKLSEARSPKVRNWPFRNTLVVASAMLIAAVAVPSAANASAIYSYTGQYYDYFYGGLWNSTENMTISFTVSSALPANFSGDVSPTSFSGFDGIFTITNSSATNASFDIQTGAAGQITAWYIYLAQNDSSSSSDYMRSDSGISVPDFETDDQAYWFSECTNEGCEETDAANTFLPPGTWKSASVTPAPEPASMALFLSGLFGLRLIRRRKR
jgi:MYXO-CTERM domain-containing protein